MKTKETLRKSVNVFTYHSAVFGTQIVEEGKFICGTEN